VAALRALYSEAPSELAIFDDAVASRLLPPVLGGLVRAATALPFGARVAHRVIGAATRGLSYGIPLRTAAIDDAVDHAVKQGTRQLVLLGAGLDARAWRMPGLGEVTVFELDHPDTQGFKREGTRELRPLAREVRFCSIDFERQTIPDALGEHDFAPAAPSVWVWEGVTMYLNEAAIRHTLGRIAFGCEPHTVLLFDHLMKKIVDESRWHEREQVTRAYLEDLGERFVFGTNDPLPMLYEEGFRYVHSVSFDELCLNLTGSYERSREFRFQRLVLASRKRPQGG
jgi:methyltransferase (TIGR00027 family)